MAVKEADIEELLLATQKSSSETARKRWLKSWSLVNESDSWERENVHFLHRGRIDPRLHPCLEDLHPHPERTSLLA